MFSSDTLTVANNMLSEIQLAAERRLLSSEKRSQYDSMLELSYPRNSIVKIILSKNDKPTVAGSNKLLPDVHSFFQVLRSGPTSVQVKNISDGTVRTIKKSSVSLVTFSENQRAKYVYHSSHRPTDKQVKHVTFCENSQILYKSELIDIEEQFLSL